MTDVDDQHTIGILRESGRYAEVKPSGRDSPRSSRGGVYIAEARYLRAGRIEE